MGSDRQSGRICASLTDLRVDQVEAGTSEREAGYLSTDPPEPPPNVLLSF